MKRLLLCLIAIMLAFSFVACQNDIPDSANDNENLNNPPSQSDSEDKKEPDSTDSSGNKDGNDDKDTVSQDGFVYVISEDGSYATVTGYKGTSTDITVSNTYKGIPVTTIGDNAFEGCSALKSVTIPESITKIGSSAFRGCSSLESITLPFVGDSLKTSSDTYQYPLGYIFGEVNYDGATKTTQYFYGASADTFIESDYYIPSNLKSVTITGGNILFGAFCFCSTLTSVTIPDDLTHIGDGAFAGCSGITSITISESVTSIGDSAFEDCTSLTSVYISDIAAWCNISFATSSSNPLYCAGENLYINGNLITELVIPEGVTSIPNYAFYHQLNITSVTIPDGIEFIGEGAFKDCSSLTSVTIPDGVTLIKMAAFKGCSSLASVKIPDSVTSIYDAAFSDCSSLKCVIIPNGMTFIEPDMFSGCSSLRSVTIPDSVTYIGSDAFYNCQQLTDVYYTGTEEKWNSISIIGSSNEKLTNVTIKFNYVPEE